MLGDYVINRSAIQLIQYSYHTSPVNNWGKPCRINFGPRATRLRVETFVPQLAMARSAAKRRARKAKFMAKLVAHGTCTLAASLGLTRANPKLIHPSCAAQVRWPPRRRRTFSRDGDAVTGLQVRCLPPAWRDRRGPTQPRLCSAGRPCVPLSQALVEGAFILPGTGRGCFRAVQLRSPFLNGTVPTDRRVPGRPGLGARTGGKKLALAHRS